MADKDNPAHLPVERWIDKPELRWLDPLELAANPRNIRVDLGDLTEMRDSIAERGVRTPGLAVPTGPDEHDVELVAGHRRLAASLRALQEVDGCSPAAARMPVLVDPDLVGKTDEQIADMLTENTHRKQLTAAEEAAGYHQLTLEGWDEAKIAKRLGRQVPTVKAVLGLHGRPKTVTDCVDSGQLSLEDAAAIAEFDDDPKALERILNDAGSSWGIRHRLADEQRKRRTKTEVAALTASLESAGVMLIKKPKGWPYNCREAAAADLQDADGNTLDPEEVKTKPGFAVFVESTYAGAREVVVCLNPAAHGYAPVNRHGYESAEERARREAEEQAAEQRRAELEAAAGVRQRFVRETYGSAAAAKPLREVALRSVLSGQQISRGDDELAVTLAGGSSDVDTAGEAKLLRIMAARWAAAQEREFQRTASGVFWGDIRRAMSWLERLVAAGYLLSDAEQAVLEEWNAELAAADDAEEPYGEGEGDETCSSCGAGPDGPCDPSCATLAGNSHPDSAEPLTAAEPEGAGDTDRDDGEEVDSDGGEPEN